MTDTANTEEVVEEKVVKDPNSFTVKESGAAGARQLGLSYDFGANTSESVDKFSEAIVHGFFLRGIKVALQGHIRGLMKENKTDAEILTALEGWDPSVKAKRSGGGRKKLSIEDMFNAMSDEEKASTLAKLMGN